MKKSICITHRFCCCLILLCGLLLLGSVSPARAYIMGETDGLIRVEAAKLLEVGYAIWQDEAWAYGYAAVLRSRDEKWDTTALYGSSASVNCSVSRGWLGRASAVATADLSTDEIYTRTSRKRLGGAMAYAGIGKSYKTSQSGSAWLMKILNLVLDPLPNTHEPRAPVFFAYDVEVVDPFNIVHSLLSVDGNMFFDDLLMDWSLQINDPTGLLTIDLFDRKTDADGRVIYELISPVSYEMYLETPWEEGSAFELRTLVKTEVAKAVPEPATLLLLGSGLIGLAGVRRRLRMALPARQMPG